MPLLELEARYEYQRREDFWGVKESCRIDQTIHSLFGASKAAADLAAQEYGRYFGMNVGVFRGGCLTGPKHSGVKLHGFLSYLVKTAATGGSYTVYGYKGKQVRDTIHSYDVVRAIEEFAASPRSGEVYNLGGGRGNSLSMREAIKGAEEATGKRFRWEYAEQARKGDHICYISDTSKFQRDYPRWKITRKLPVILQEIAACYAREKDYVPIDIGNRGEGTGAQC